MAKKVTKEDISAFLAELEEVEKSNEGPVSSPRKQSDPFPEINERERSDSSSINSSNSSTQLQFTHIEPTVPEDEVRMSYEIYAMYQENYDEGLREGFSESTDKTRTPTKKHSNEKQKLSAKPLLKPADEKTKKESKFPWKKGTKKQNPSEESTKHSYDFSHSKVSGHVSMKTSLTSPWKTHYCLVDGLNFFIFKSSPEDNAWKIDLSKGTYIVSPMESEQNLFCFRFQVSIESCFYFGVEDSQERDMWIHGLRATMHPEVRESLDGNKNQTSEPYGKGAIRVYVDCLQRNQGTTSITSKDTSKGILIDTSLTTIEVINMVLQKCQINETHEKYGLFERTQNGDEFLINDLDHPLVLKNFWELNEIQHQFCINERYPNIGVIEPLNRSDVMKRVNDMTNEELNEETSNPVEIIDSSIQGLMSDLFFSGTPTSQSSNSLASNKGLSESSEEEPNFEEIDREFDFNGKAPSNFGNKNLARLSAVGGGMSFALES